MNGNKRSTAIDWTDPDDAPDLSTPEYQAKFATVPVRRGRPKAEAPKVHIGFRLAADVVESVKASGPNYNVRIEQVLRKAGFGSKAVKAAAKAKTTKSGTMTDTKSGANAKAATKKRLAAKRDGVVGKRRA